MSKSIRYKSKTYKTRVALHKEKASDGLSYDAFVRRIYAGWPVAKALRKPAQKHQYANLSETVEYNGKIFTSLTELSAACGIPYGVLRRRWQLEIRGQELVAPVPWELSKIEPLVDGKQFSSLMNLASTFKISYNTAYRRWRRGWSDHEIAYGKPRKKKRRRKSSKKRKIKFRGKTYKSIAELCHAYGVKPTTYRDRHDRRGYTVAQTLGVDPLPDKRLAKYRKRKEHKVNKKVRYSRIEVICDGVTYPNYAALARAFDLPNWQVYQRIKDYGYTPEQAVGLDDSRRRLQETVVGGKTYRSFGDACFNHGIDPNLARTRLNVGCSLAQALELEHRPTGNEIEVRGKTYDSMVALGKAYGISDDTLFRRRSHGWTLEESLGLVERSQQWFGRYNERYFEKHPDQKNSICALYFVKLHDKKHRETYYKIGITTVTTTVRLAELSEVGINTRVLAEIELNLYSAWQLEQMLFDEFSKERFTPDDASFAGRTECFKFDQNQVQAVTDLINEFQDDIP